MIGGYVTSCGALPYRLTDDELEILLVLPTKNTGTWGFPKGHLEASETIEECVRREVREETGVSLDELEEVLPIATLSGREGRPDKKVIVYLAKVHTQVIPGPIAIEEIADVRFFNVNRLPPLHKYQRSTIEHGIKMLREKHGKQRSY